jgi:hypothetical protein
LYRSPGKKEHMIFADSLYWKKGKASLGPCVGEESLSSLPLPYAIGSMLFTLAH